MYKCVCLYTFGYVYRVCIYSIFIYCEYCCNPPFLAFTGRVFFIYLFLWMIPGLRSSWGQRSFSSAGTPPWLCAGRGEPQWEWPAAPAAPNQMNQNSYFTWDWVLWKLLLISHVLLKLWKLDLFYLISCYLFFLILQTHVKTYLVVWLIYSVTQCLLLVPTLLYSPNLLISGQWGE